MSNIPHGMVIPFLMPVDRGVPANAVIPLPEDFPPVSRLFKAWQIDTAGVNRELTVITTGTPAANQIQMLTDRSFRCGNALSNTILLMLVFVID